MKDLRNYILERLDDSTITGWFDDLKDWFNGKIEDAKYDAASDDYEEKEKLDYIKNCDSAKIKSQELKDTKVLEKMIERSYNKNEKDGERKTGFLKTAKLIKANTDATNFNKTSWLTFIYASDKLTEPCGVVAYRTDDPEFEDKTVVFFSEFLSQYKSAIDYEDDVLPVLDRLGNEVVITSKPLIQSLTKAGADIFPIEGKKDAYQI